MVDYVTSNEENDPFEVGKNYTGMDVKLLESRPFRYGFIFAQDITEPSFWFASSQVTLPFPPSAVSIDEPAATNIVYTQNSGKFIERRGQISKTITISGTTGFNYAPELPSIARRFTPKATIVEIEGPNSGMGRFMLLRNLFRRYWSLFSDDKNVEKRANAGFIFINEKDDEAWLVEPMSFRMSRQSPTNKFTYQYEIVMQTIARVEDVELIPDPLTFLQQVANARAIVGNIANGLTAYASAIGDALFFISGVIKELSDGLINTLNTIASGLRNIQDGISAILAVQPASLSFATSSTKPIPIAKTAVTRDLVDQYTDLLDAADVIRSQSGEDPIPFDAHAAMAAAVQIATTLGGRNELFNQPFKNTWSTVLNIYDPTYGFGGLNQTLLDPLNFAGVREAEILPGDDLVGISIKELRNAERFQEIVVLNNLKPPYISPTREDRLPNTLAPGDSVLLPAPGTTRSSKAVIKTTIFVDPTFTGEVLSGGLLTVQVFTNGKDFRVNQWAGFTVTVVDGLGAGQERKIVSNTANTFTVDKEWSPSPGANSVIRFYLRRLGISPTKSANEQLLGVDLKLQNGDLVVTPSGDLMRIDGTDNMTQAIQFKLNTRANELAAHPSFGLGITPGQKGNNEALVSYKAAVRQTLLSDARIDSVQQLDVTLNRDVIDLKGYVLLTGSAQPFAVDTRGGGF